MVGSAYRNALWRHCNWIEISCGNFTSKKRTRHGMTCWISYRKNLLRLPFRTSAYTPNNIQLRRSGAWKRHQQNNIFYVVGNIIIKEAHGGNLWNQLTRRRTRMQPKQAIGAMETQCRFRCIGQRRYHRDSVMSPFELCVCVCVRAGPVTMWSVEWRELGWRQALHDIAQTYIIITNNDTFQFNKTKYGYEIELRAKLFYFNRFFFPPSNPLWSGCRLGLAEAKLVSDKEQKRKKKIILLT